MAIWNRKQANAEVRREIIHIDALYGYAVILTHNHAEAEDLVQETLLRSIQAKAKYVEDGNRKAWLFTILRNIWLVELRKQRGSKQPITTDYNLQQIVAGRPCDAHEKLERHELQLRVRRAILQLPHSYREIILLREYEELSYKEIGRLLNCAQGTVMSRLWRARSLLRMSLEIDRHTRQARRGRNHPELDKLLQPCARKTVLVTFAPA